MDSLRSIRKKLKGVPRVRSGKGFMAFAEAGLGHIFAKIKYLKKDLSQEYLTHEQGIQLIEELASDLFSVPLYTRPKKLKAHCKNCKIVTNFDRDPPKPTVVSPPSKPVDTDEIVKVTLFTFISGPHYCVI